MNEVCWDVLKGCPVMLQVKVLKQFGRPVEGIRLGVAFNAARYRDESWSCRKYVS